MRQLQQKSILRTDLEEEINPDDTVSLVRRYTGTVFKKLNDLTTHIAILK